MYTADLLFRAVADAGVNRGRYQRSYISGMGGAGHPGRPWVTGVTVSGARQIRQ
jgi:hypothetical protein